MKQKEFKIGDKVYSLRFGWGVVKDTDNSDNYPILVSFKLSNITYTIDGKELLIDINPSLYHTEYGPHIQSFPRIMEVYSEHEKKWMRRVIIGIINNHAVGLIQTDCCLKKIHRATGVTTWPYYREVEKETITELTLEQVAEKVGIPAHLLRIKE